VRLYTGKITPTKRKPKDYLLILSIALVAIAAGWIAAWSNHFQSSFHFSDFPVLVSNSSMHHASNFGRFFTTPRISSVDKDSVGYRPLLSAWFAFDYQFLGGTKPFVYQAENFAWFAAVLVALFGLLKLMPGVRGFAALFATLLFGLHPMMADTVNYASQQGTLIATFAVLAGLVIFAFWPWRLPQTFPLTLKRVPEHGLDEYLRKNYKTLEQRYVKAIHLPIGLYLWPIVPALLCDASTVVFAPILAVYVAYFETRRTQRSVIPAWIICGGWWIFQMAMTWKFAPFSKTPPANYWFSQPWVAVRYLYRFFFPYRLSADSDFYGFANFWNPLASVGVAAVLLLAFGAYRLGKSPKWRVVAFGIWWYLIALVPQAVVRQGAVEANWRATLPYAGLALAIAGTVSIAMEWLPKRSEDPAARFTGMEWVAYVGAATVAVAVLAALGWGTHGRNRDWASEADLWRNTMENSPGNGRAIMYYGLTRISDRDLNEPLKYMQRADAVAPGDPLIEVNVAGAHARLSQSREAEAAYKNAIQYGGSYSPAWSAYGQWLLNENRLPEAQAKAQHAVELDPYDMTGRRVLMDLLAQQHLWPKLEELAQETLRLLPDDPDAERSLEVAQTGKDEIVHAVEAASSQPSVDHFLELSVLYFKSQRYQDCIDAAQQALKIKPDLGEAYSNIASAYHALGRLDETIEALQNEVRLNPNLPSARSNLEIELAVKRGQRKE